MNPQSHEPPAPGPVSRGGKPAPERERPYRRDDLLRFSAGPETFLYDRQADAVHVLNSTALALWELCDGLYTPDQMADYLTAHFAGVPQGEAAGIVWLTLATLEEKALIRWPMAQEEESHG